MASVPGGGSSSSSSRLSSHPLQIPCASNPTTDTNTKDPRDPPQPTRQNRAEIDPPPRLLEPIKDPADRRHLGLPIRTTYLERRVNVRDRVGDGAKAGREAVFVEAVA